uniref:AlNc14C143G7316 protein n=1 Tax=Albugo laibachii Nc14 TaxID=890382 RepID=F0WLC8_9STRA|nr:AlNc14C143G7316 [Albugo laibachii Nc14]|eukprot:CCA22091.1 AlNc14C143G7316 [Albugo laibachii Nc14]
MQQSKHFTRITGSEALVILKTCLWCVSLPLMRATESPPPPAATLENYTTEDQESTSGLSVVSIISILAGCIGCVCVLIALIRYAMTERGRRARTCNDDAILEGSDIRFSCQFSSKYQRRGSIATTVTYSLNGVNSADSLAPKGFRDIYEKKNVSAACDKVSIHEYSIPMMRESSITSNPSTANVSLVPDSEPRNLSAGSIIIEVRKPQMLPYQPMRPARPPPLPPVSSNIVNVQLYVDAV